MKKLLFLIVLGGAAYGGYYYYQHRSPAKRVCAKLADLCGEKGDRAKGETDLDDMVKKAAATPETMSKLDTCVASAKSCPEATGCMFGTGMNVFGDALNQFMKGMGNSLGK